MKMPINHSAERAAIAILIQKPELLTAQPWEEDLFEGPEMLVFFQAIRRLADKGIAIDFASLCSELEPAGNLAKVRGAAAVSEMITEGYALASSGEYYLEMLTSYRSARRTLRATISGMKDVAAMTMLPSDFATAVAKAAEDAAIRKIPTLREQLMEMLSELEGYKKAPRHGFGFGELDAALHGGGEEGELIVAAGPTSGGKSVLLLMAALEAARANHYTAIYSLEMPAKTVLSRMTANLSRTPVYVGETNQHWLSSITRSATQISKFPLYIRDDLFTLPDILRSARAQITAGAKVVIIDYIQRIDTELPKGTTLAHALGAITRDLKRLALETKTAIFTASQLNDDGMLRDSRAIGHDADIVLKIGDGEIRVDKFRRGERDQRIPAVLVGSQSRFERGQFDQAKAA